MISFVNSAQAAAASFTYPTGIKAGDFIIVFAYRNTTTAPTLGTGFTNILNGSGNANAYRVQYKKAAGTESGTTSPTFTNANGVICVVYRGVSDIGNGGSGATAAASLTATLPAVTAQNGVAASSWIIGFIGSKQTTSISTPSGYNQRGTTQAITSGDMAAFDKGPVGSTASAGATLGSSATNSVMAFDLIATAPAHTLTDNFPGTTLNAANWTSFQGTGTTFALSNQVNFSLTGATADYAGLQSLNMYDLTGSQVSMCMAAIGPLWASKEITLSVEDNGTTTNSVYCIIGDGSGGVSDAITFYKKVASTQTSLWTATYDATAMKYLRIRESGGNILFDTSPDGVTWTNRYSGANPINVQHCMIEIDVGHWGAETGTGTVSIDQVNTTGKALTETLTDNFDDNTVDTTKWGNNFGSYAETGGAAVISYTSGSSNYSGYSSTNKYDLTGSYVYAQLVNAGNQALTTFQALITELDLDSSNKLTWYVQGNSIHAQTVIGGVATDVKSVAYVSGTHKWFRIREASGVIYWDYSTDGLTWTNFTSRYTPFLVTAVAQIIGAGAYASEASSTSMTADNFNTPPVSANKAAFLAFF